MMGLEMVRGTDAHRASQIAAVLLGSTILAGLPAPAFAQDAGGDAASTQSSQTAPVQTIQSIQVTGAERLEPQTVLSYIKLRVGQPYSKASADAALKDLYETELFADVQISNDNGNVTIQVKENPVVNRIILEGNKRIKDDKILPEIKVAPRQIFTRSKIRADVARIIELYKRQGRYAATVEPKMVMLDQNRVDIVFEITEGDKSKVRQINIIGNDAFSDGELRGQMVTKQARWHRIFSSGTSYDPDRMAFDQQKLRQFYLTQGYADFRVVSAVAELTPDKKDFIITYVVEEGERYKFGDVKVESQLRDFDGDKLAANLPMKAGDWYNAKLVEDTIENLNNTAGAFGYAFADVRPQYDRNKEDLTMGLTFVIREAPRVYVERIDINGNTLTQDKVIRREFRLAEGDAFNSLQVRRSTNRIKSLGYFQEKFEVEQKPGSAEDRIVLEANVEEKPTGELQLSAGFSSLESFIFQASIRQRNFRGRGQTVGLSGSYSRYSKSVQASFVEPYLFDKNVSLGVDIYRRDYNNFNYYNSNRNTNYEQTTTGFQIRAGLPLTEYITAVGRYTLNYDDVSLSQSQFYSVNDQGEYACDPLRAGRYLCDALGKRLSSIAGFSLIYDTLDNRVRPSRGTSASINIDVAGLGGDVKYARLRANAAKYWSLGKGFIFSLSGEGGIIKPYGGNDVRLTDRFYLGQPQMRGFAIRGLGPRVLRQYYSGPVDDDTSTMTSDSDDALGGNYYYMGRAEMEIPLGSGAREMGLRPSIFVDAGAVWGTKKPELSDCSDGCFIGSRDGDGNQLYYPNNGDDTYDTTTTTTEEITNGLANQAIGSTSYFTESYLGDTWLPRVAVGFGVNWNSPFGPFRIDIAKVLVKRDGDDTRVFSFNVGTQF